MRGNVRTNRLRRSLLAGAAAAALALSACGGEAPDADGEAAQPGEIDPEDVEPGGTMSVAVAAEPAPAAYFTGRPGNLHWNRNVLETLVMVDQDFEPQPWLANDWELSDDNTTLVLTLEEGVTFHSGREFTSDDVVFALEHAADGGGLTQLAGVMEGWEFEATGELEVTITAPTPLQEVVWEILDSTPIIDQESYEGIDDGSEIIGTGPFVWDDYSPGSEVILTRNDDYWVDDLPYLDAIEIQVIGDPTAQLSALRSDAVQMASGLPIQDAQTIADGESFHLDTNHGIVYNIQLDVEQGPFDDQLVRQAIGYAIDRDRINDQVFGGLADTGSLPWAEQVTGYPDDLSDTYTYDPDRAREMIEEAGATGAEIEFSLHAQPVPRNVYQIVANNLEEVGLSVSASEYSVPDFEPRRSEGELGPIWHTWDAQVGFPPALMTHSLLELRTPYRDDAYGELATQLRESPDDEATEQALRELSEYLQDEAFMHTFAHAPATSVRADGVEGEFIARYGRSWRELHRTDGS